MTRKELIKLNLSNALKETGMKPNEIAKLTGLSCATIRKCINMRSIPHIKNIVKICKALNLSLDKLIPLDD